MAKYLILGRGYSGRVLERLLKSHGHQVTCTSRHHIDQLQFNLDDEKTWGILPREIDGTFITLPFKKRVIANRFADQVIPGLGKVVFMGTTSAFLVEKEHQWIRENSDLDPDNDRNAAESELVRAGCICVHSAGIYGPNRSPIDWIEDGRVTPSDRYVNFIHVEDLARVLYQAMALAEPGTRYIASDGSPMTWSEIIANLKNLYGIHSRPPKPVKRASKRIDSRLTVQKLGVDLKFKDVIHGIQSFHE